MAETRHTLQTLLTENDVHIPQLQRDYAQGRKSESEIRKTFIEQLRTILETDGQHLNLDFIYGYIKNNVYYPLDGQQRLSTLWLLHWYLAPQEACSEAKEWLKIFGYRTRITAERFCLLLVEHIEELRGAEVVNHIKCNSPWFHRSWEDEPTVAAMLVMLKEIETQMGELDRSKLWKRLTAQKDQTAITFDSIDIHSEDFNLTDELYIKMNARGKPLTEWECYKAHLIDSLPKDGAVYTYEGESLCSVDYFSFRVDKEWLDLFWATDIPNPEETEKKMLHFFHTMARLCFFRRPYTKQGNADDRPVLEFKGEAKYNIFSEEEHATLLIYTLDLLHQLHVGNGIRSFFDQLSEGLSLFSEENLFDEICKEEPDVRSQVLLLFILEYMRKYNVECCDDDLKDFARVVRNQLERTRSLDSRLLYEPNVRINRVNTYWSLWRNLTEERKVYQLLSEQPEEFLNKYEQQKAMLIKDHPELKDALLHAEEHPLLRGLIGILQKRDWASSLSSWTAALYEIWNTEEDYLIAQALIACGYRGAYIKDVDYGTRKTWLIGKKDRWGTILTFEKDLSGEIEQSVRELLDKYVSRGEGNPKKKLEAIVEEYLRNLSKSDWQYYFCKYPEMFQGETNYFACIPENLFDIRLLGSFSRNPMLAYHCNPYALAVNKREKGAKIRWSIGSDSVALEFADSLYLSPHEKGWSITWAENPRLTPEGCREVFVNFGIAEEQLVLKETPEKDRVEVAVDFYREIQALLPPKEDVAGSESES